MLILTDNPVASSPPLAVAAFGVGLIGSSVAEALQRERPLRRQICPMDWDRPAIQADQLSFIEGELAAVLNRSAGQADGLPARGGDPAGTVGILWSAGKAGFSSSGEETAAELSSYRAVLQMAERLGSSFPGSKVTFSLASSAGGLFEGQRAVDPASEPAPLRPYGQLKLDQERMLQDCRAPLCKRIYRLSSVYGYVSAKHRRGLIPTLILNGIRHQVSAITGRMDTLRDFVWVEDVAAMMASDLLDERRQPAESISVLASAKPSSLYEIQGLIEAVLGHRLYVTFSTEAQNSLDITFARAVLPTGWWTTDLSTCIQKIYRHAVSSGLAF